MQIKEHETVAHFIRSLDVGGAEKMLEKIAFCTQNSKFPAEVWSSANTGPIYNSLLNSKIKYRLFNFKSLNWMQFSGIKKIRYAKVLQGWMYEANILSLLFAKVFKKPVVWNIRQSLGTINQSSLKLKLAIYISSKLSFYADAIIYNSELSKRQHEAYGFDSRKSYFIPNGFFIPQIDLNMVAEYRAQLRKSLGIDPDSKIVLSVGRKHYDKGQDLLVAAAQKVIKTNKNIHFVFIGRNMNYASTDNIHYLNEISLTEPYYLGADLFALTSRAESFPNVLGEAMSYALPCISTNVGDCVNILSSHDAIVNDFRISSIASKVLEYTDKPVHALNDIGQANRLRIIQNYSLNKVSQMYINLYEKILRG